MNNKVEMFRAILGEYLVELPEGNTIEEIKQNARNILICERWWEDLEYEDVFAIVDSTLGAILNRVPNGIVLFHKEYDSESISDYHRDLLESFDPRFNPIAKDVEAKYPTDELGFNKAKYVITIEVV